MFKKRSNINHGRETVRMNSFHRSFQHDTLLTHPSTSIGMIHFSATLTKLHDKPEQVSVTISSFVSIKKN